jgi:predicted ArsR family transcriptional regulator
MTCGRPSGEIRDAVVNIITQHGAMCLRDLLDHVQTTPRAMSSALRNMIRDGVIEVAGHERRAHAKRWVAIYDLVGAEHDEAPIFPAQTPAAALQSALSAWSPF